MIDEREPLSGWTVACMAVLWAIAFLLVMHSCRPALGHEHHGINYSNWTNRQGTGCCNDHDCRPLDGPDLDESRGVTRVRIDGEWCDVQSWHYLRAGNAPDWSTAHVCVRHDSPNLSDRRPCSRLLCFQPQPKF